MLTFHNISQHFREIDASLRGRGIAPSDSVIGGIMALSS
jgi:hypothetical protein